MEENKNNKIVIVDPSAGGCEEEKEKEKQEEIIFDLDDLTCVRPGFFTRTLLWLVPRWGVMRLARELGYPLDGVARQAHEVFANIRRVDVLPAVAGGRGFQLVLDENLSLYFFQDGDHFVYDGYEVGDYERGDVRVFDADRRGWEGDDWEEEQWGEE